MGGVRWRRKVHEKKKCRQLRIKIRGKNGIRKM
jgi:hypothetical protein